MTRRLGRTDLQVSALGMGCWAIGGAMTAGDQPLCYAGVDDAEARRALERAVALGVTLFDTADAYGAGHSERLLAPVLAATISRLCHNSSVGEHWKGPTPSCKGPWPPLKWVRRVPAVCSYEPLALAGGRVRGSHSCDICGSTRVHPADWSSDHASGQDIDSIGRSIGSVLDGYEVGAADTTW